MTLAKAVIENFPYDTQANIGEFIGDLILDTENSTKKTLIAASETNGIVLTATGKFDYTSDESLAASTVKAIAIESPPPGGTEPVPYLEVTDIKEELELFLPEIDLETGILTPNPSNAEINVIFDGNDTITGGPLDDVLSGDPLTPQEGDKGGKDKISGNTGSDIIFGDGNPLETPVDFKGGKNTLDGGEDNDFLVGGLGKDTITGGEGLDTFVLHLNAGKKDQIQDFDETEDALSLIELGLGSGEDAFSFLDTNGDAVIDGNDDYTTVKKGTMKLDLGQAAEDAFVSTEEGVPEGVEDAGDVVLKLTGVSELTLDTAFVDVSIEDLLTPPAPEPVSVA